MDNCSKDWILTAMVTCNCNPSPTAQHWSPSTITHVRTSCLISCPSSWPYEDRIPWVLELQQWHHEHAILIIKSWIFNRGCKAPMDNFVSAPFCATSLCSFTWWMKVWSTLSKTQGSFLWAFSFSLVCKRSWTIEWGSTVHHWFVPLSAREFNVLVTTGMSAGSVAILVRSDSWDLQYSGRAGLPFLHLGFRFLPYIRSRDRSYLDSKMEHRPGLVCIDKIFGFLGSRGHHLLYVTAKFIFWSLIQSNKPILQGSTFLMNHMLHVCSCTEWMHVRAPHSDESWRICSLICQPV